MKAVRIALVVFALFAAGAVVLADSFAPATHACNPSTGAGCH